MARAYTKLKRADHEAATKQRITEAALALHGEIGPNRTTISLIAQRAGVQRHTVYTHFPDDRAMFMACSGLHGEREPLPSPEAWETLNDPAARLRAALTALYAWFERNEAVAAAVLRDAETNPVLAEIATMRLGPGFAAIHESLGGGLDARGKAALTLATSFHTWRTLVREAGLSGDAAVSVMCRAVAPETSQGDPC